ncbi:hypothetical protein [Chlamydia vaughanii]|uniref:hypothetical protein n=1 Tax=Chlamydia vaughanii TaxID=3112552 RepID=UPI0032B20B11
MSGVSGIGGSGGPSRVPPGGGDGDDKKPQKANLGDFTVTPSGSDSDSEKSSSSISDKAQKLLSENFEVRTPDQQKKVEEGRGKESPGLMKRMLGAVKNIFTKASPGRPEISPPRIQGYKGYGTRLPEAPGVREHFESMGATGGDTDSLLEDGSYDETTPLLGGERRSESPDPRDQGGISKLKGAFSSAARSARTAGEKFRVRFSPGAGSDGEVDIEERESVSDSDSVHSGAEGTAEPGAKGVKGKIQEGLQKAKEGLQEAKTKASFLRYRAGASGREAAAKARDGARALGEKVRGHFSKSEGAGEIDKGAEGDTESVTSEGSTADKVKGKVREGFDKVKGAASEAGGKIRGAAAKAGEGARALGEKVRGRFSKSEGAGEIDEGADSDTESVSSEGSVADKVKGKVREGFDKVKGAASDAGKALGKAKGALGSALGRSGSYDLSSAGEGNAEVAEAPEDDYDAGSVESKSSKLSDVKDKVRTGFGKVKSAMRRHSAGDIEGGSTAGKQLIGKLRSAWESATQKPSGTLDPESLSTEEELAEASEGFEKLAELSDSPTEKSRMSKLAKLFSKSASKVGTADMSTSTDDLESGSIESSVRAESKGEAVLLDSDTVEELSDRQLAENIRSGREAEADLESVTEDIQAVLDSVDSLSDQVEEGEGISGSARDRAAAAMASFRERVGAILSTMRNVMQGLFRRARNGIMSLGEAVQRCCRRSEDGSYESVENPSGGDGPDREQLAEAVNDVLGPVQDPVYATVLPKSQRPGFKVPEGVVQAWKEGDPKIVDMSGLAATGESVPEMVDVDEVTYSTLVFDSGESSVESRGESRRSSTGDFGNVFTSDPREGETVYAEIRRPSTDVTAETGSLGRTSSFRTPAPTSPVVVGVVPGFGPMVKSSRVAAMAKELETKFAGEFPPAGGANAMGPAKPVVPPKPKGLTSAATGGADFPKGSSPRVKELSKKLQDQFPGGIPGTGQQAQPTSRPAAPKPAPKPASGAASSGAPTLETGASTGRPSVASLAKNLEGKIPGMMPGGPVAPKQPASRPAAPAPSAKPQGSAAPSEAPTPETGAPTGRASVASLAKNLEGKIPGMMPGGPTAPTQSASRPAAPAPSAKPQGSAAPSKAPEPTEEEAAARPSIASLAKNLEGKLFTPGTGGPAKPKAKAPERSKTPPPPPPRQDSLTSASTSTPAAPVAPGEIPPPPPLPPAMQAALQNFSKNIEKKK